MINGIVNDVEWESGIISLREIYLYVENDMNGKSLYGKSSAGRAYAKLAKELVKNIADKHGFYLWGNYSEDGEWNNIYIGKAGSGKTTHLKARILEELKDERSFLWCRVMAKDKILDEAAKFKKVTILDKHKKDQTRAMKKKETSHIIWVSGKILDDKQVNCIESYLISKIKPSANSQISKQIELNQYFIDVVLNAFAFHINSNIDDKFDTKSIGY